MEWWRDSTRNQERGDSPSSITLGMSCSLHLFTIRIGTLMPTSQGCVNLMKLSVCANPLWSHKWHKCKLLCSALTVLRTNGIWARLSQSTESRNCRFPWTSVAWPHYPPRAFHIASNHHFRKKASFRIKKSETKDQHLRCSVQVHIWSNFKIIFLEVCHVFQPVVCGSSPDIPVPAVPSLRYVQLCSYLSPFTPALPLSPLSPFNSTSVLFDPVLISNSEGPLRKGEGRKTKG